MISEKLRELREAAAVPWQANYEYLRLNMSAMLDVIEAAYLFLDAADPLEVVKLGMVLRSSLERLAGVR